MTHSLHRLGNKENLKTDYVILVTPAVGINHEDSKEKLRAILNNINKLEPNNIGSYETGTIYSGATIDQIKNKMADTPRVRCCFDDKEKVISLLRYIKEQDFGLSVTVSGLIEDVKDMASHLEIRPHSINLSLGFYGQTHKLPEDDILELITMCGHGMISKNIIKKQLEDINYGLVTIEEAAVILAKPCVCGIFNTKRAEELLKKFNNINV